MKKLHFKTKEKFRKWIAYQHMRTPTGKLAKHGVHSIAVTSPVMKDVVIAGHEHHIHHHKPYMHDVVQRPFVHHGEIKKVKHNVYS